MSWTKRTIVASLVMGTVGAIIGGFYAGTIPTITFDTPYPPLPYDYRLVPLGVVPGFLSCFFVSIWYLKFMQNRSWKVGLGFGPLFGALAGVISGFVILIGVDYLGGALMFMFGGATETWVTHLLASLELGAAVGAATGLVVGFLSAAIVGPLLIKSLTESR